MKKKLPVDGNQDVYQLTLHTSDGEVYMTYINQFKHIQGSGLTRESSKRSLEIFLDLVLNYDPN